MQNRRSWEGESPSELEDLCRRKVAVRSFIEASWSTYAEQIILPSNRTGAAAWSLQTVYDLPGNRQLCTAAVTHYGDNILASRNHGIVW